MDTELGKFHQVLPFYVSMEESQWLTRMMSSPLVEEGHALLDGTPQRERHSKCRSGTCKVDLFLSKRVKFHKCRARQFPFKKKLHSLRGQSFI
ncbi:hypothetical protein AVEN_241429-1 [Araneus ventricosus]|uniref:Uncharacterized protein n=1 Tax=Araneus ventricosus TaxID=182803 RepID=A0A4Y2I1U3_ARAVE|nr:hypothetical protein AVEN_22068-1 [Araneus ventricosus]GBN19806.1 hypothetical protein AVEN_241429-1 [Araneus ventricosus]